MKAWPWVLAAAGIELVRCSEDEELAGVLTGRRAGRSAGRGTGRGTGGGAGGSTGGGAGRGSGRGSAGSPTLPAKASGSSSSLRVRAGQGGATGRLGKLSDGSILRRGWVGVRVEHCYNLGAPPPGGGGGATT